MGQQLDADQLAFGGLGPAFGSRAVLAEHEQLVSMAPRLLALQQRGQLAMHLEVGIARIGDVKWQ